MHPGTTTPPDELLARGGQERSAELVTPPLERALPRAPSPLLRLSSGRRHTLRAPVRPRQAVPVVAPPSGSRLSADCGRFCQPWIISRERGPKTPSAPCVSKPSDVNATCDPLAVGCDSFSAVSAASAAFWAAASASAFCLASASAFCLASASAFCLASASAFCLASASAFCLASASAFCLASAVCLLLGFRLGLPLGLSLRLLPGLRPSAFCLASASAFCLASAVRLLLGLGLRLLLGFGRPLFCLASAVRLLLGFRRPPFAWPRHLPSAWLRLPPSAWPRPSAFCLASASALSAWLRLLPFAWLRPRPRPSASPRPPPSAWASASAFRLASASALAASLSRRSCTGRTEAPASARRSGIRPPRRRGRRRRSAIERDAIHPGERPILNDANARQMPTRARRPGRCRRSGGGRHAGGCLFVGGGTGGGAGFGFGRGFGRSNTVSSLSCSLRRRKDRRAIPQSIAGGPWPAPPDRHRSPAECRPNKPSGESLGQRLVGCR